MATDLRTIEKNIRQLFSSLDSVCKIPSPWIFLCLAAVIDYLSNAAYPEVHEQRQRYQKFIGKFYLASYGDFRYLGGQQDLPKQMCHVLRNGLIHSFSLVPDDKGKKWSRPRSIVLAHRSNANGKPHLSPYNTSTAPDNAYFVAEDFLSDTKKAANRLLRAAEHNRRLAQGISKRFAEHPPITWYPGDPS